MRLLAEPHGFKGLGAVTKAIDSNNQAVTKCINVGGLELDLDAISPNLSPLLDHDDPVVRSLDRLLASGVSGPT